MVELINNPIDQIADMEGVLDIPYTTTASIDVFNEVAGNVVTVAEQTADVDRNILARQFSEFNPRDTEAFVERVELGYFDETYDGTNYYSVITEYEEMLYESVYTGDNSNSFYEWDVTQIIYRKESHYQNKLAQTIRWDRPFRLVPINTQGVNNDEEPEYRKEYLDIADPFILTVDCQSRIAARVKTDAANTNVTITTHNSRETLEGGSQRFLNNEFICTDRYITISITNTNQGIFSPRPLYIEVEFYGVFLFNISAPTNSKEIVTLEHIENTPFEDRLFPPGKKDLFPDQFWNSGPKPPLFKDSINRTGEAFFIELEEIEDEITEPV